MARRVTTLLLVGAFVLMLWIGALLPQRPADGEPKSVRREYAIRLLSATTGVVLCLIGAGVGSILIVRQARREYREAALRNLRTLVESEEEKTS